MPLSRSPSPSPGGGWSSPGLNIHGSGRSSPSRGFGADSNGAASGAWESTRSRNAGTSKYPSFSTQNQGFFTRHMRQLSSSLPRFHNNTRHADKEKHGHHFAEGTNASWALLYYWRRTSWLGGGEKFVIILAANVGGGVMEWKGAREWAIERDSTRNKKRYAARWGYDLEIVDMSTKKRYAHEWRESWEKVDFIRQALRKYPNAEWFWWLDLNTYVMEPSYSLQDHIFNNLQDHIYRDINDYNPLNIPHPLNDPYLDTLSRNVAGDGKPDSVNLVLSQDCSGFNLGSFFIRKSEWTDRLLDVWWDPVAYEQKHMDWEHKEQDALEQLYIAQPWIRQHTGFLPQRMINSFPQGACSENGNNTRYHYDQKDRDFLVNMAGCEWGRDCWGEMYNYRELSYYLNRSWWERFKEDFLCIVWFKLTGRKVKL
ncbi:alpha-mannosyltransferase [Grosmannia clavigera kw1407]|uniref:Alpha-mannosyltransferase n=1 Tax=Grosmannia clavigera (strain kw1407 / UAMH 11150) TaxID=655863 RepID=F0XII5_GROCL|nr:alpha-mannosyltransferase [Grosmannia clavigera kw1407]EFX02569.1 alpha-mannosyltransferase [Grosmannia clavigera kw1407]